MKENPFIQQIKAEGRKEALRESALFALENRFGAQAAGEVADAVNALEDLAQLDRLFRLAVTCQGIDEFRAALAPTPRPSSRRNPSRQSRR
jgi:hypothetical protein